MSIIKNTQGEINDSPIPISIQKYLREYGMRICSFYSGVTARPRQLQARRFSYYVISHLIEGKGRFWTAEMSEPRKFSAGEGVIVNPGLLQFYGGDDSVYIEDSVGFIGPAADVLFGAGIIRSGVIQIGSVRRLMPIIEKIRQPTVDSLLEANIALQALLVQLHHENPQRKTAANCYPRLQQLISDIQSEPAKWWTVSEMAEYSNISENQLRRVFLKHTGMSPKDFIDNIKIRLAIERLCNSNLAVKDIAESLGYSDAFHFSRRFSQLTGVSPIKYRMNFSPNFNTF